MIAAREGRVEDAGRLLRELEAVPALVAGTIMVSASAALRIGEVDAALRMFDRKLPGRSRPDDRASRTPSCTLLDREPFAPAPPRRCSGMAARGADDGRGHSPPVSGGPDRVGSLAGQRRPVVGAEEACRRGQRGANVAACCTDIHSGARVGASRDHLLTPSLRREAPMAKRRRVLLPSSPTVSTFATVPTNPRSPPAPRRDSTRSSRARAASQAVEPEKRPAPAPVSASPAPSTFC